MGMVRMPLKVHQFKVVRQMSLCSAHSDLMEALKSFAVHNSEVDFPASMELCSLIGLLVFDGETTHLVWF